MPRYEYDEKMHKTPTVEYDLDDYYFIVHDRKIKIFKKGVKK